MKNIINILIRLINNEKLCDCPDKLRIQKLQQKLDEQYFYNKER